jgi:hypothetical protein
MTGFPVTRTIFLKGRFNGFAALDSQRAARLETTARRRIDGKKNLAFDGAAAGSNRDLHKDGLQVKDNLQPLLQEVFGSQ